MNMRVIRVNIRVKRVYIRVLRVNIWVVGALENTRDRVECTRDTREYYYH